MSKFALCKTAAVTPPFGLISISKPDRSPALPIALTQIGSKESLVIVKRPTKASPSPLVSVLFKLNVERFISQFSPAVPKQKWPTTTKSPDGCRPIESIPSSPWLPKLKAEVQFPDELIIPRNASVSPLIPTEPNPISSNNAADVNLPATTTLSSSKITCPVIMSSSNPPPI